MGLHFRRRRGRGQGGRPQPARRQGRQPRRDVQPRPAGAARLHHHHGSLQRLLRQWPPFPSGSRRRSRPRSGTSPASPAAASAIPAKLLLVSVRSGARASMPGMMDTVLNLGLNDETVEALAADPATRVSPMTATAASSRCIPTSCSGSTTRISRRYWRTRRRRLGPRTRHRILRRPLADISSPSTRRRSRRSSASPFRRIRTSSSGARSARCFRAG